MRTRKPVWALLVGSIAVAALLDQGSWSPAYAWVHCETSCGGKCCVERHWGCTTEDCEWDCLLEGGCDLIFCAPFEDESNWCCNGAALCINICKNGARRDKVYWCRPSFDPTYTF